MPNQGTKSHFVLFLVQFNNIPELQAETGNKKIN